jgi:hypothetical protein
MDFWPFIRQLPDGVTSYACQIFEEGFREIRTLESLKESGSVAEKTSAAERLAKMGVPGAWFRERFGSRYPGYTEEQTSMLFAFAAQATR